MANPQTDAREALLGVFKAAIDRIGTAEHPIFDGLDLMSRDMQQAIRKHEEQNPGWAPPYGVVNWERADEAPWGLNNVAYEQNVRFFLIDPCRNPETGGIVLDPQMRTDIEQAMFDLSEELLALDSPAVTILDIPSIDTSDANSANQYFTRWGLAFYAAELRFRILWGYRLN